MLIFSLNGLPRHLLNDLIICTEKSFFEGPARHRSRSGEAGGSEGLSDPEPVEGKRARGIKVLSSTAHLFRFSMIACLASASHLSFSGC